MTDDIAPVAPTPVEAPAPALAPAPAPVAAVESAAPTPVVPAVEAPAPTPAPAAVEVAKEEAPAPAPTEATILSEAPKEEAKEAPKEETKTEGEQPKVENKQEGQSDEPAPLPVFEAFTFPEGVTPKEETLKKFTELLTGLETEGKAEHAKLQEFGQKAVDFHQKELQRTVDDLNSLYQKTWSETKVKWKDQFLNDPEIGGNRAQTTITSALSFIRTHGGTAEQQAEFRTLMDQSGLGNHPIMIRMLANAGRAMAEGRPLAASAPPQVAKSKTETLYGQKGNYINK